LFFIGDIDDVASYEPEIPEPEIELEATARKPEVVWIRFVCPGAV